MHPIRSEGGHADLAGTTKRELQVIATMTEFLDVNVSAEQGGVSGTGMLTFTGTCVSCMGLIRDPSLPRTSRIAHWP